MDGVTNFWSCLSLPVVICSYVLQVLRVYLSYLEKLGDLLGGPQDDPPHSFSLTLSFISNLQRVVTPLQERRQRRMLFFHTTIRELQVSVCALELEKHNYSWHSHSKGPDQSRYKIHCLDTISLQLTLGVCWSLNNLLICCLFFDSSSTFQATDSTTLYWFNKINICYSPFLL